MNWRAQREEQQHRSCRGRSRRKNRISSILTTFYLSYLGDILREGPQGQLAMSLKHRTKKV